MGEVTGISWTDHTFNPWWGCTRVSPGCDHCYAEAFDKRVGGASWGKGAPRREFGDKHWAGPRKWNNDAFNAGVNAGDLLTCRRKVFCASMADVMDDEAPVGARERLWKLIDETPYLTWQLLTKRPARYERYLPPKFKYNNVWLGITAENQHFYDLRMPFLMAQCLKRDLIGWVSYEPALGPLVMDRFFPGWIIFGGESGPKRRPCEKEWARDLMLQCQKTGTKFFVKQMSARTPAEGKALIPPDLMIQEFPRDIQVERT